MVNKLRSCLTDAQVLLKRIFDEKLLKAKAVFGLFPANTVNDDDIEVYVDELSPRAQSRGLTEKENYKFLTLSQQLRKEMGFQILP